MRLGVMRRCSVDYTIDAIMTLSRTEGVLLVLPRRVSLNERVWCFCVRLLHCVLFVLVCVLHR